MKGAKGAANGLEDVFRISEFHFSLGRVNIHIDCGRRKSDKQNDHWKFGQQISHLDRSVQEMKSGEQRDPHDEHCKPMKVVACCAIDSIDQKRNQVTELVPREKAVAQCRCT